jgi:hypothetical protein
MRRAGSAPRAGHPAGLELNPPAAREGGLTAHRTRADPDPPHARARERPEHLDAPDAVAGSAIVPRAYLDASTTRSVTQIIEGGFS